MARVSFKDVIEALDRVDEPGIEKEAAQSQAVSLALGMARPQNWWGLGPDGPRLLSLARDEGLPVAWIPRTNVLVELLAAPDSTARTAVLLSHEDLVVEDLEEALAECSDPWLADHTGLAGRAIAAYRAGFPEAAMALAVSIGEPLALWASTPRVQSFDSHAEHEAWKRTRKTTSKYKWAEVEIAAVGKNISAYDFKYQVVIAPIPSFFTPFHAGTTPVVPELLSRHVVAHQPSIDHYSRRNSLTALMLVTSILREQQEWADEVRASDEPFE